MTETKKTLEELLLDLKEGRYGLIGQVKKWLPVMRKSEDYAGLSEAELIKKALEDIVNGDITDKEIKAGMEKLAAMPVPKKDRERDEKFRK